MPFNIIFEILWAILNGRPAYPNSASLENSRGTFKLQFIIPEEWVAHDDLGRSPRFSVPCYEDRESVTVRAVTYKYNPAGAGPVLRNGPSGCLEIVDVKEQECWFSLDGLYDPPLFIKPFVDGYVSFLRKAIEVDDFYLERMMPSDLVNMGFARRSRLKKPETAEDWERAMVFAAPKELRAALAE